MKPKDLIGMKFKDADEEYGSKTLEECMEKWELNTCDKCTRIDLSVDLVWITEDFTPKDGEEPSDAFYKYWADAALCESCYKDEL